MGEQAFVEPRTLKQPGGSSNTAMANSVPGSYPSPPVGALGGSDDLRRAWPPAVSNSVLRPALPSAMAGPQGSC